MIDPTEKCRGCGVTQSLRYQEGKCPGGCFSHNTVNAQATEIERLRASREKQEATYRATCAHHDSETNELKARLAEATALPGRIWEALGELTSFVMGTDHVVRVYDVRHTFERFLANQPAVQVHPKAPAVAQDVADPGATDRLTLAETVAGVGYSTNERGPDGVSERWKKEFIPPSVRKMARELLDAREATAPKTLCTPVTICQTPARCLGGPCLGRRGRS